MAGGKQMELTVLAVPDCPNAPLLEARLSQVLEGLPGVTLRRVELADLDAAARWRMHGSPTFLVDGRDPFAEPGTGPALACRLYRGEKGRLEGAPTTTALRQALEQARRADRR
jgi:hypothetical protein